MHDTTTLTAVRCLKRIWVGQEKMCTVSCPLPVRAFVACVCSLYCVLLLETPDDSANLTVKSARYEIVRKTYFFHYLPP